MGFAQSGLEKHLGPVTPSVELGQDGFWTLAADENWFTLTNDGDQGAVKYFWRGLSNFEGRDFTLKTHVYTQASQGDQSHAGILFNFREGNRYMAITISSDGGAYIFVRTPDGFNINKAEGVVAKLDGSDVLEMSVVGNDVNTFLNNETLFNIQLENGPSRRIGVVAVGSGTSAFTRLTAQ
ncbi:MAG: hypothetical protein AAGF53_11205 [Pseudomonadota bacterium]